MWWGLVTDGELSNFVEDGLNRHTSSTLAVYLLLWGRKKERKSTMYLKHTTGT